MTSALNSLSQKKKKSVVSSKPGLEQGPSPFYKALGSKISVECNSKDLIAFEGSELVNM